LVATSRIDSKNVVLQRAKPEHTELC